MGKEPRQVETRDLGLVYDAVTDSWSEGYQSVFRPNANAAKIDISAFGLHEIISAVPGKSIRISSITFVIGQLTSPDTGVSVTLYEGATAISGPMDFADEGEPRGIVITFPYAPLGLYAGNSFSIETDVSVQVSGIVCYFYQ